MTRTDYDTMAENQERYFAAVREKGGVPWFEDPDKRQRVATRLGVPVDSDLRRALFDARNKSTNRGDQLV
ncbi:hypothetical protein [Mycobacteroides abscessus]|uniref:hypothetical protein n=1 Tax=Mycobacteroides abscessus TaxID=36809 RepID=UPI0005E12E03|nr:hypothetical protein [Mycobacteroides abscessus]CPS38137.1 Uncharacterised protein [Mycobacteroides abscessus]CPS42302.1 Uncharacterised protein [Mycobacteroides abscessus]CPS52336.1 Uncharacterised protein [Mycobacteroides abscessus]CPT33653.1 Uncharacterised protein [Mycobacteroides abscessus]CPT59315.1 Uncharacterised protein [Mycobacteroides abscessus]